MMFSRPRFRHALVASIAVLLPLQGQQNSPAFLKHIFPSRDNVSGTTANQGTGGGIGQLATAGNGITYHGGPLMLGTPNVYYIWYGNWASDPTGVTILQHLIQFEGGSPYYGVNTTYYDGSATHISNSMNFGPSYSDNYSRGKVLGDADILAIVSAAITGGHLPSDPNGVYFVLTWQDVQETSGFIRKYCGWHTNGTVGGVDIKYAFVGDANTQGLTSCAEQTISSPNGDPAADAMASVIAHELEESTSDPDLNAWFDSSGEENADKCAWTFGTTYPAINGSSANMNLGGFDYLIQQNWVNSSGGYCALSLPNAPSLTASISPSSGAANSSVPITITGTNLSGGTINISGTGVSASNVSTSATQITATFTIAATAAAGVRNVTVTTAGGTSNAETFTVITTQVATPTFTPPAGTYSSGQSITIGTTTAGASIRFTTDGSTPTSSFGTVYVSPVPVSSNLTLKAIAYKTGMTDSLVASAAYTISGGGGGGPSWYNSSWTNRKAITIDHTKVSGASNLTNFPVLISLASDTNLQALAQSNGNDILFTASDGVSKLNHEIESYSSSNGKLNAWVQVPSLSPTADTTIYIYYGNAAAANQQNKAAVWDSSYRAVIHLADNTATPAVTDSTSNGNNGTASANSSTLDTPGQIGGGFALNGSNGVSFSGIPTGSTVTMEAWVNLTNTAGYQNVITTGSGLGWWMHGGKISLYTNGAHDGMAVLSTGTWYHAVIVQDGVNFIYYLNGAVDTTVTGAILYTANITDSGADGGSSGGGETFSGKLDELRVSNTVRSADWILTEFHNQGAPGTFYALGSQETGP